MCVYVFGNTIRCNFTFGIKHTRGRITFIDCTKPKKYEIIFAY